MSAGPIHNNSPFVFYNRNDAPLTVPLLPSTHVPFSVT